MADVERRWTGVPVELRAKAELRIGGYAAVFDKLSQNLGGFVELVSRSFFTKSRMEGWPRVLARYNHDDMSLLGTTAGGTLRLEVDDFGLLYEVDLPKSRADVAELVGRGDVTQSSFAFRVTEDDWGVSDQGFPMRTLLSGQLVDVAPVNTPAYLDSTVAMRSLAAKVQAPFDEIRAAAEADDLRKYLAVTGGKSAPAAPRTLAAQARIQLLAREQDPWA